MVGLTLPPYLLSRAVDDGLVPGRSSALLGWSAALLGVGVVNAWLSIMRHRTMTRVRMDASFRTTRVVLEQVTRLGASLSRRVAAGEVLLAVEPTSALDAHTEAILAGRLHAARADRTTVVTTTSALLVDDRVIATGSHRTLLDTHLAYRDLIVRGDADGTAEADAPTATDAR